MKPFISHFKFNFKEHIDARRQKQLCQISMGQQRSKEQKFS